MLWTEMALVGRIARPHGLRGQVIVNLETDFPEERFQPGSELFVERGGRVEQVTVTTVRFHRERPVIGLRGVESITEAQSLAGLELRVPLDALAALPEGAFYRHDLIGCRVETTSGGAVGVVTDVEGSLAGSRLVIAGAGGEVLVPLAAEICREIDAAGKRIVIDPPDGLIDLNTRT
ncbi:MAG TPA: ribosome maturation factor RimM [Vicinamibacterales bacterium]|nr:ribosome maturation factor RimM [Vicinamibacterales bacterium]